MNLLKKLAITLLGLLLFCVLFLHDSNSITVYANNDTEYSEDSAEYKIWYHLKELGYNDYAIAGAMGNMYWESYLKPDIVEFYGTGYGLAQWTGSRKDNLISFCDNKYYNYNSIYAQIEFFEEESNSDSTYYNWINNEGFTKWNFDNATTVEESTSAFFYCYERANDDTLLDRIYHAYRYYDYFTS